MKKKNIVLYRNNLIAAWKMASRFIENKWANMQNVRRKKTESHYQSNQNSSGLLRIYFQPEQKHNIQIVHETEKLISTSTETSTTHRLKIKKYRKYVNNKFISILIIK